MQKIVSDVINPLYQEANNLNHIDKKPNAKIEIIDIKKLASEIENVNER